MSHGPSSEGSLSEPNLTPLLDMVLQLLMFFIMCVNFVNEQNNEDIKLPESFSARPMDKADTDVLFINIKPFNIEDYRDQLLSPDALARLEAKFRPGDPCVKVVSREPMRPLELKYWLKDKYEEAEKIAKEGKVQTTIIIRAHRDTDYGQVFHLLHMCKVQGYRSLKLRALTKGALS